ncbi:MAG: hypothetical protein AAGI90_02165 [Chlamydiota bacterium]
MFQPFHQRIEILPHFGFSKQPIYSLQDLIPKPKKALLRIPERASILIEARSWEDWAKELPMVFLFHYKKKPFTLRVSFIYRFEYTEGVDRHIGDTLSRWLLPGKRLAANGSYHCRFFFKEHPERHFSLAEFFFPIQNYNAIRTCIKNGKKICEELKLHILAIYYTRQIFAEKDLPSQEKLSLIERHLTSVTEYSENRQTSHIVRAFSREETSLDINKNVRDFFREDLPSENEIFHEIRRYMLLFPAPFALKRSTKHLSRILTFLHLFRKRIQQLQTHDRKKRQVLIKVFQPTLHQGGEKKRVLGILVCINLLTDKENFNRIHLVEGLSYILPNAVCVKGSYIFDRRSQDPIRSIYVEIEKNDGKGFSLDMIKTIKKELPPEIIRRIETVFHPIFMPTNDEELMRNIILLASQLRYVKDLPQVIISYDKQTPKELSFRIIVARLLRSSSEKVYDKVPISRSMKISFEQKKTVGLLKNKYPKEALVLRASMNKAPFFRKDYSLDLQKARRNVARELIHFLGEFRDYNGGMILKKTEAFNALLSEMPKSDAKQEFLLEHFFYAIEPPVMQTVLETKVMKSLFSLVTQTINHDFSEKNHSLLYQEESPYFLTMMTTTSPKLGKTVIQAVKKIATSSYDLVTSSFSLYELSVNGIAYKCPTSAAKILLQKTIEAILSKEPSLSSS